MQKEVLVSVCGVHSTDDPEDIVEVLLPGEYYFRNGVHYVIYEQYDEETNSLLKNTIKVKDDTVELKKTGVANVCMRFAKNKNNTSYYDMEQGSMLIETKTADITIQIEETRMKIYINYGLYINEQYVSDVTVNIKVIEQSKT